MKQSKRSPGFVFWLIWAVALVPLLVSSVAFFNGWRPGEQINQGELYPAGVTLQQLNLDSRVKTQTGRWQLILLLDKPCDKRCEEWQKQMPNLHASLGKDRERLQWQQLVVEHQSGGLLLVDPRGFMVTRYSLQLQPQGILKDLKRLLKISRVG